MQEASIAAVVLSFNRPSHVRKLVQELIGIGPDLTEIIVVDNHSDVPCSKVLSDFVPGVTIIRTGHNEGTSARNHGLRAANSDVVITLDDDLYGLTASGIATLRKCFRDQRIAAVNFKVLEPVTEKSINWCHPRPLERFADTAFETDEISEGAVAFRRAAVLAAGLYPNSFFISHEGPDLAFRLLNLDYKVTYDPRITVYHARAQEGRPSWRRYYYDTRNVFWLAARNLPLGFGLRRITRQIAALFVYAVRDRHLVAWTLGVRDGLLGIRSALRERRALSQSAMKRVHQIEQLRPGIIYWARKRLFRRGVQI